MKVLVSTLMTVLLSLGVGIAYAGPKSNGNAYGYGHCYAPGLGDDKNKHTADDGDCSGSGGNGGHCRDSLDLVSEKRSVLGVLIFATYAGEICDTSPAGVDAVLSDLEDDVSRAEGLYYTCFDTSLNEAGEITIYCGLAE